MNWAVVVAGLLGLGVALFGFLAVVRDARRERRYGGIALALGVALAVVALLIAFGDDLLR
jgi:hypothetical protein